MYSWLEAVFAKAGAEDGVVDAGTYVNCQSGHAQAVQYLNLPHNNSTSPNYTSLLGNEDTLEAVDNRQYMMTNLSKTTNV